MYGAWRVPTLIAYPPPPAEPARPRPILAMPRVEAAAPSVPWSEVRSPRRRRRDCVFIPDMDIAIQFIEARRRAAGMDRVREDHALALPTLWDTPLVLGVLMTFAPPLAVTMLWSSSRFPRTAQIALTLYGALTTLLMAAIVIAALT